MFKNYLKIAFRNLTKQKTYSLINILGLALGITCCLLIALYVLQETNYDTYHKNVAQIYRVSVENTTPEGVYSNANTPFPLAAQLQADYPEVAKIARIYFTENDLVSVQDRKFFQDDIIFADPDFFDIFSYEILQGSADDLLNDPSSVVLTASASQKYFGEKNPLGEVLTYQNTHDFTVTAVMADVPVNSHFRFEMVFSGLALTDDFMGFPLNQWGMYTSLYTYLLLPANISAAAFEEKLSTFMDNHSRKRPDRARRAFLTPMQDIYLYSHIDDEIGPGNHISNLMIIATIGAFILLIACINFMNLTTARSIRRAREVGVRKVLGAQRLQLIGQFIGESLLLALLAMLISLAAVELVLPAFSELVSTPIEFSLQNNMWTIFALFGFTLLTGIFAGIYPAFFLSAYQPVETLKGNTLQRGTASSSTLWQRLTNMFGLRRLLVVTQFALTILLISGTLITQEQLRYMQDAELGFEKAYTVNIPIHDDSLENRIDVVTHEFLSHPNVLAVTAGMNPPLSEYGFSTSAYPNGREAGGSFGIHIKIIDTEYLDFYGMELLAGRNFSENLASDVREAFIINEATLARLGYSHPEEALGRVLSSGINRIDGTIIGVVKDFHVATMHQAIEPVVIMHWPRFFNQFSVKIKSAEIPQTLDHMRGVWAEFSPDYPFQYTFLDEDISTLYTQEENVVNIVGVFSLLAIFVACLGLFGLAAYTAEQRTKEIGVRKVLGATVNNIILLLTRDFLLLIAVAALIAAPVAYWLMNNWLTAFAYRIEIQPTIFLLAAGLALLVALITIAYQAVRAALANPVDALRYE